MSDFQFKQFSVCHDHSSMKVGTDAVLLGAWASSTDGGHILDIGTGCGVVALMMAQRFPASPVDCIDIDDASIEEARGNAGRSPFSSRITLQVADVRQFAPAYRYDTIVCNPPYFTEDTTPPEARRSRARNAGELPFSELITSVSRLLGEEGLFHAVIPTWEVEKFLSEGLLQGLYLLQRLDVQTVPRKTPKRTLLTLSRNRQADATFDTLVLQNADGTRSEAYMELTEDFYL